MGVGQAIARLVQSFRYAGRGLWLVLRSQANARIHALATVVAVALAAALRISALEWCAIVTVVALVWAAEALNTALEALADAAVPAQHAKVAMAKDVAAAGVLVCAVAATLVGGIVFLPRLLAWIGSSPP